MKKICLYFQVHQPTRLRLYRFFDIGKDSHYYDDFTNRTILRRIADRCYLPMNALLLEEIRRHDGNFRVAFSISGSALEQFERYAPEVTESFRALARTGCVEFLCETYYHSLAALVSPQEFAHQVNKHRAAVEQILGVTPVTFRNTELIYSDEIGRQVYELGFKTMLTEGAKHVLGWKSPNYVYSDEMQPKLKLLLRNATLSDDIAFRFSSRGWSEWPLTAEKYVDWLLREEGDIVNLFMDYETFGEHQKADSGIFDFMRALPAAALATGKLSFVTPSQGAKKLASVGDLDVSDPISWADEERDLTAWLGNELQDDAFNKIYSLTEKLSLLGDPVLWEDFGHLQESDHFYYMCTKFFSDGAVHQYFNPYDTPYEAFINYMNVVSDFILRVNDEISVSGVAVSSGPGAPAPRPVRRATSLTAGVPKKAAPRAAAKKAAPKADKPAAAPKPAPKAAKPAAAPKAAPKAAAPGKKKKAETVKKKSK